MHEESAFSEHITAIHLLDSERPHKMHARHIFCHSQRFSQQSDIYYLSQQATTAMEGTNLANSQKKKGTNLASLRGGV
jgi:hypothetical protein